MPLASGLQQHMGQPRAGPQQRIVRDSYLLRDLVGSTEADAVDVLGQGVWVGAHLGDGIFAVGLVNTHGPAGTHAVGMEKDHNLTNYFLLGPGFLDAMTSLRP